MTAVVTWVGDALIVAGAWGIGNRRRGAFAFTVVGECVWIAAAVRRQDWALAAVCVVFVLLAIRSAVLWGRSPESDGVRR
jgi:hypothetical protein